MHKEQYGAFGKMCRDNFKHGQTNLNCSLGT